MEDTSTVWKLCIHCTLWKIWIYCTLWNILTYSTLWKIKIYIEGGTYMLKKWINIVEDIDLYWKKMDPPCGRCLSTLWLIEIYIAVEVMNLLYGICESTYSVEDIFLYMYTVKDMDLRCGKYKPTLWKKWIQIVENTDPDYEGSTL